MKIDRVPLSNIPDTVTEKTDSTVVPGTVKDETSQEQAQTIRNPSPKTDSVELKTNSFFNFDKAAKLDSSKTNITGTQVPATMLPGVPFREKVELPKTLPNGTSVNSGVASGDLGLGKTHTGPNHMGIDMKGNEIKNQLNDALNLKTGAGVQSSTPPSSGTVNYNNIGSPRHDSPKYEAGFNRPGMGKISADKTPQNPLGLDEFKKADPPPSPGVAGEVGKWIYNHTVSLATKKTYDEEFGTAPDPKKYTNPEDPSGTEPPVVTGETLAKVKLPGESTTQPGVQEDLGPIDSSKLSTANPHLALIGNPNPEQDQSTVLSGDPQVKLGAKGPDTVNPRDPELGGGSTPIIIDPNRPKP